MLWTQSFHLLILLFGLYSPPFPPLQCPTSTDSPIYSTLYATPPPPLPRLSAFQLSTGSLFFPSLEVGHWVNTTKCDVISKVTQWVMSGKVRGKEQQVRELKTQRAEGGRSKINFTPMSRGPPPKPRVGGSTNRVNIMCVFLSYCDLCACSGNLSGSDLMN